MELFRFNTGASGDPTVLEQGEAINRVKSVRWSERYMEPGEFEITAQLSSGLRDFLPIGTFISHNNTLEVMIVENHEIKESEEEDPIVVITGRSLEVYLENRIVGAHLARASSTFTEYELAAANSWTQAVKLINDHIVSPPANANDVFGNVVAVTDITGTGTSAARVIKRGNVHQRLMELLEVDNIGVRTERRNTFPGGDDTRTLMKIHKGENKAASVIFSWKAGDLASADYLFSNKKLKNSALVQGRYVNTVVDTGPIKHDRRMMIVDADDIDGNLGSAPTGATLTAVINKMIVRGQQELKAQKQITISRADISNLNRYNYREDYYVGDLITLDGNWGQIAVMRVSEYAEIEDETGESGHPTLSLPEE